MKKIIRDGNVKVCIFFIAITFFSSIWYGVFTVDDGLVHYVWAQTGNFFKSSWSVAIGQGRIMYFIYNICSLVPYIFDNLFIYNLFSFSTIVFCAYSLWRLLSRHWSREAGFLGVLLYFAFAQADFSHNFFVSYIVVLQGAIALFMISMERLLTYCKDRQKKYLIQSALFLVIAASTYESLILYSILIFFIMLLENSSTKLNIKKSLIELKFHILFMFIYLAIYFIFRKTYPSQYDANTIGNLDLFAAAKITLIYCVGMFPGMHFLRIAIEGINILDKIEMLDIVKMILTGTVCFQLIKKDTIMVKRIQIYYLPIMLIGTVLPCVLYGFTERHVEWVKNGTMSYGASYYSYYFWILLITILCIWFYHVVKYKRIFLVFSVGIIMTFSMMTSISNRYFGELFKGNYERYSTFGNMLQSDSFTEIEENSQIYVEGSSGIHGSFEYISSLAYKYTGRYYEFITDAEQIDFSRQVYMIKRIDGAWILGRVNSGMTTDKAYVFIEKKFDKCSLVGQAEGDQAIYVNGQNKGIFNDTFIVSISGDKDGIAVLEGEKLNIRKLQLVDKTLENNTKVSVIPMEGFYEKEGNFWWAMSDSVINIEANDSMKIHIDMEVISAVDTANLKIIIGDQINNYTVEPVETKVELDMPLRKGENLVQLVCDGKILSSKEDLREKAIRIFEPNLSVLK